MKITYAYTQDVRGTKDWATAIVYPVGEYVKVGKDTYRSLIAHTSGVFATDLDAGRWVLDMNAAVPTGFPQNDNQKNVIFSFNVGDWRCTIQPNPVGSTVAVEVPAKVLRQAAMPGSGLAVPAPAGGDRGPHEDWLFLQDSVEYTYTTRQLVGAGVIEKQMPVGAVVGQEGRMILYKGATTIKADDWTERLIRPFLITAADLATRQTGQPSSGSAPTVNAAARTITNNGGDGYNHI
jgi:hypothetical protein